MDDKERLYYAKQYVESMANGINPLNNQPVAETDLLNNVHISRCLFFTANILQAVIDNNGVTVKNKKRKDFYITDEQRQLLKPQEHDLIVSEIAKMISSFSKENECKNLQAATINKWLLNIGMLELLEEQFKIATAQGVEIGITSILLTSENGREYYRNTFSPNAQQFIFDNIDSISEFQNK